MSLLLKRSNCYYFRWQVPADIRPIIGKREITHSLGTGSKLVALSRAAPLFELVNEIKEYRKLNVFDEDHISSLDNDDFIEIKVSYNF